MNHPLSRRSAIARIGGGSATLGVAMQLAPASALSKPLPSESSSLQGNINHSVCKWCYSKTSLKDLCASAAKFGMASVELLSPKDWKTLNKHNLICAMSNGPGGITKGFNRLENHGWLKEGFDRMIPQVANAGYPNIICFSGNRNGLDDEQGIENCATGLKKIIALAEKKKVTVCMELLNSRVNHKDYQCDHTEWGVELVKRVGSERFRLLYDIYHMQIMEGDVIRTIRTYSEYIAHYHTGGNPGRNEIDETQELNYPAIMKAIRQTGFKGYVAQEFIPTREPMISLQEAVKLCDV